MTARRDRSVTSAGRHSAGRPRRLGWRPWTAALVLATTGASAFVLRDDLAPALRLDAFTQPAGAAPVADEDGSYVGGVYAAQAPVVPDAQVVPPRAVSGAAGGPTSNAPPDAEASAARAAEMEVPARSGQGRRVVFAIGEQRVWLVRKDGTVARTYQVSGSKHDNLDPGTYEVYSRSRHATSYDLGSTMEYFVRFTRGENAPIGFHTIPVDADGDPLQARDQLGTPRSSGCVRQRRADAVALWRFAPVGTTVVVVA